MHVHPHKAPFKVPLRVIIRVLDYRPLGCLQGSVALIARLTARWIVLVLEPHGWAVLVFRGIAVLGCDRGGAP